MNWRRSEDGRRYLLSHEMRRLMDGFIIMITAFLLPIYHRALLVLAFVPTGRLGSAKNALTQTVAALYKDLLVAQNYPLSMGNSSRVPRRRPN